MESYKEVVRRVLKYGKVKENRTGVDAISVAGGYIEHDMSTGFPMLTTKKMAYRLMACELEFFIKGITDKQWLLDRNNHIWDEWCSPLKVPYGHDEETLAKMKAERDLGPIYGFQWRHFDAPYKGYDHDYTNEGVDQLVKLVETLRNDPKDRRMIVSAWNPKQLHEMALPPCHYGYEVTVIDGKINLLWSQRSVDVALGLPFNLGVYGTLLHLLCLETGLEEGNLIGLLGDVHIYKPHIEKIEMQIEREVYELGKIVTENFISLFDWEHTDSKVVGYESHEKIVFEIAV
ncbi:thymidylate synthase [Nanoarchaeota archaeon]